MKVLLLQNPTPHLNKVHAGVDMKKSLFAAAAVAALMAMAATAAPIPSMELNGVASATKVAVINGGGSGGMIVEANNATKITGKTSLAAKTEAPKNVPLVAVLTIDKAAGKKSEAIVNAPAPNMLTNDVAVTIDPPKNGSSDKVVGTGGQYRAGLAHRQVAIFGAERPLS
jgi:hypothetical protein